MLYVTTVPFGLETPSNFEKKWERTETLPFYLRKGEIYHPSDLLGNFLLFLPFGFAWQGWRREQRHPQTASLWSAMGAGMLMSFAIETTQFFLRDRFTSINDWILNVAGTAAGAWIAKSYSTALLERMLRFGRKLLQRPGVLVLLLLLFTYALFMLLPFNFTLSTNNLVRKWQQWKFSAVYLASLPHEILTLDRREYWLLVVWENVLFGTILGGQLVLCQLWYRPGHRRSFYVGLAWLGLAFFLNTLLQFLVIGSTPDVLPLLAVVSGAMLGIFIMTKKAAPPLIAPGMQQLSRRVETWFLLPGLLLLTLLLLRPDLPDLRVMQMPEMQNSSAQSSTEAFFTYLLHSVRPSVLSLGGSAYFRLFLKLLLVTAALAFALATVRSQRLDAGRKQDIIKVLWGCALLGLGVQALRFYLWQGGISLLAVFALALGGASGVWLENCWRQFNLARQRGF